MDIRLLQNYALKLTEICLSNSQKIVEDASDQPTPGVIITINDLLSYKLDVCK